MPCKRCGAPDHAEDKCPQAAAPDKVDELIAKMSAVFDRSAQPQVAEPEPDVEPVAAAPHVSDADIAKKFRDLIHEGKADEAYLYVTQNALNPQLTATYEPILATMGQQNVQRLRDTYGDKFTKRETFFNKLKKEYKLTDAALASPKVLNDLWLMTRAKDPSWEKEESDARLAAARKEWEAEASKTTVQPASLGPVTPPVRDDLKSDAEKYLAFDSDPAKNVKMRNYLDRQLMAFGVSHEQWLEQRKWEDDPRAIEQVGEGPFIKRTWTRISPPRPKTKGA